MSGCCGRWPVGTLPCLQSGPALAEVIPAGRRTTWNPGIPGGIPSVTTVHTTMNAATYGDGVTNAATVINNAIQAAGATASAAEIHLGMLVSVCTALPAQAPIS